MFDLLKWRNKFFVLDIYQALRPVFLLSKYFGTYVYSHSKINKYFLYCYTIILILFISVATAYSLLFIDLADAEWYENWVYFYLEKTQITLTYICFIVTLINHVTKQEKLGEELRFIQDIDVFLKKQNFRFIYNTLNHLWITSTLVIAALLTWFLDCWFYTNSGSFYANVQLISSYFPLLVIYSSVAQWYSLIKILGDHFVHITISALTTSDPERLLVLIRVHGRLCTISRAINDLFGQCLLIWVLHIFVMMTEYLFIAMKILFEDIYNYYTYATALISFIIVRFISLWAIVSACERTSIEADVFTTTICKLLVEDNTGRIAQNEVFLLHISMKNALTFTGCRYFNINYKLVQSMIAASATLLVILIQFDMTQSKLSKQDQLNNGTCDSEC